MNHDHLLAVLFKTVKLPELHLRIIPPKASILLHATEEAFLYIVGPFLPVGLPLPVSYILEGPVLDQIRAC